MVNVIGRTVAVQAAPAKQQSSVADAIAMLGNTMFGDRLTPALKREQLRQLQAKSDLITATQDAIGSAGEVIDPQKFALAAALGTVNGRNYAQTRLAQTAQQYGAESPEMARAQMGAGESISATAPGLKLDLANKLAIQDAQEKTKLRIADSAPMTIMTDAGPQIVRQRDAFGQKPVLSTDQFKSMQQQQAFPALSSDRQQDFLFGADSPGEIGNATTAKGTLPVFARKDGLFNVQTGERVTEPVTSFGKVVAPSTEALRPNVRGELQQAQVAQDDFINVLNRAESIATRDPTLFGVVGQLRRAGQAASETMGNVAQIFGAKDVEGVRSQALAGMKNAGVNEGILQRFGLFDPNIPELQAVSSLLVYKAASALAGQSGRAVTDKDIDHVIKMVGDPVSWTSSQQDFLAKAKILRGMISDSRGLTNKYLGTNNPLPPAATPQPASPAPLDAPAQGGQPRVRRFNPATGKLE